MTELDGARLDYLLDALHWNHATLARILDVRRSNVLRWANGAMDPPPNLLPWLETLASAHLRQPLPLGWNERATRPSFNRVDAAP